MKYKKESLSTAEEMEDILAILKVLLFGFIFIDSLLRKCFVENLIFFFIQDNTNIDEKKFFSCVAQFKDVTMEKIEQRRESIRPVILEAQEEVEVSFSLEQPSLLNTPSPSVSQMAPLFFQTG